MRSKRSLFNKDTIAVIADWLLNLILLTIVAMTLTIYNPLFSLGFIEWFCGNQIFRGFLVLASIPLIMHYFALKSRIRSLLISAMVVILLLELVFKIPLSYNRVELSDSERLRVLCFNIMAQPPQPVFDLIVEEGIDLASFEEVRSKRSEKLIETAIGMGLYAAYQVQDSVSKTGCLVISRAPLIKTSVFRVESSKGNANDFVFLKTKLKNREINVVPLYLEPWYLGRGFSNMHRHWGERRRQAHKIRKKLRDLGGATVVLGDFNATPTDRIYRDIKRGLKDSWIEAGRGLGATWHRQAHIFRIDFILYRGFRGAANPRMQSFGHSDHLSYRVDLIL